MTFRKKIIYGGIALSLLLLAACAPQNGIPVTGQTPLANETPLTSETPSAGQTPSAATPVGSPLPPQVVLDAQQWLASQLGVLAQEVQIVDIGQVEWPDSCLGLGRLNESCAQVITPGWRAVFNVYGRTYEVRTDETGSTIRLAATDGTPTAHAELENMFWSLVSFGPPDAQKPVAAGSNITLLISNGLAGGLGGCNSYGGSYEINGDQISFSNINSTLRACADDIITQQEQDYLQALQSTTSYEVNGNTLRIMYNNGQGVLTFESAIQALPTATAS